MESWNFGSEGKGFGLSDEIDDVHAANTALVMGWDLKTPFDYDTTRVDSGHDVDDDRGFSDLGFSDLATKSVSDSFFGGVLDNKIVNGIVSSPTCVSNSKEFSLEESSSRLSSNVGDSNSRASSLIDLNLGRLTDYCNAQIAESSKDMVRTSTAASFEPEKKARTTSINCPSPVCQVYGCNMDLSNSKEYHKRHKVCDAHSKTAKVIVNGIEQRFCQQCSRFHLLVEFDNGKRSCRKRLAGHNERRRKPQVDSQTARSRKLHLPPYNGSRFPGISLPTMTSFMNPNISSITQPIKYESTNWCRQVKLEHMEYGSSHPVPPVNNQHFLLKPSGPLFGVEKQFPFLHGTDVDIAPKSNFTEYNNRYPQNLTKTDSISRFRPWTTSSSREDATVCDDVSTIHGVSGATSSRGAFSLLSSHSQNSSTLSSGIPIDQPLLIQGNQANYNLDQFSAKLFGLSSQTSTSSVSNKFSSSVNYDRVEPVVTSDASNSFKLFDVQPDGIFQESDFVSAKDPLSPQHQHTTVDLLQLSSQLQRVEQQRHSMQVKEEDDTFFRLPFT